MKVKKETVFTLALWRLLGMGMGFLSALVMDAKGVLIHTDSKLLQYSVLMLCVFGASLLQLIAHEGGHLVFGLLTGYKFVSFRIFSLALVKLEGRLHLKRLSLPGTAGQCLMAPPEPYDPNMPTQLYNFGGVLMNLLVALLAGGIAVFAKGILSLFLIWVAGVGVMFALQNGVPMRLAASNDGMNARNIRRDSANVWALWTQLKVQQELSEGKRLKDLPREWFQPQAPLGNDLVWSQETIGFQQMLDEGQYAKALETGAALLPRLRQSPLLSFVVRGDLIFLNLILKDQGQEKALALMGKDYQKLSKKLSAMVNTLPNMIRTEYAKAVLLEKDMQRADKLKKQFEKAAVRYPYPSEILGERDMMAAVDAATLRDKET